MKHGISLREQTLTARLEGTQRVLDDTIRELNEVKDEYEKLKDLFVKISQLRATEVQKYLEDLMHKPIVKK
jgi:hypothetical protein